MAPDVSRPQAPRLCAPTTTRRRPSGPTTSPVHARCSSSRPQGTTGFRSGPDSQRVAFQSDRDGDLAIFRQPADGTGAAERLTRPTPGETHAPESWSPKGDSFLFTSRKGQTSRCGRSRCTTAPDAFGDVPLNSTDRRRVLAGRELGGLREHRAGQDWDNLRSAIPSHWRGPYQLFAKGADSPHHPRWSPDGKELFYDANPKVTGFEAVSVTTHPTLAFGNAVAVPKLFLMAGPTLRTPYDITPDGRLVGRITAGTADTSAARMIRSK